MCEYTNSTSWCVVFCFKQKTAYEMRMSDWSSDVCSSDLEKLQARKAALEARLADPVVYEGPTAQLMELQVKFGEIKKEIARAEERWLEEIGRASCWERVCQYV